MGHVADRADVDGGLAGDNFRVERGEHRGVEAVEGLFGQVGLRVDELHLVLNDILSGQVDHLEFAFGADLFFCHSDTLFY